MNFRDSGLRSNSRSAFRSSGRSSISYQRFSSTSSYTDVERNLNTSSSNMDKNIDNTAPDLRFRQLQGKIFVNFVYAYMG